MKAKGLFVLGAIVILMAQQAVAVGLDASGNWESKIMGARVKARIDQNGDRLSGVAKIQGPDGRKGVYHFKGRIDGNRIYVAHHQGHSFSGVLTPQGRISGVLTTRSGHSVNVSASRRR